MGIRLDEVPTINLKSDKHIANTLPSRSYAPVRAVWALGSYIPNEQSHEPVNTIHVFEECSTDRIAFLCDPR